MQKTRLAGEEGGCGGKLSKRSREKSSEQFWESRSIATVNRRADGGNQKGWLSGARISRKRKKDRPHLNRKGACNLGPIS